MAEKRGTRPGSRRQIVGVADLLPEGYEEFLGWLKECVRTSRLRAAPSSAEGDFRGHPGGIRDVR